VYPKVPASHGIARNAAAHDPGAGRLADQLRSKLRYPPSGALSHSLCLLPNSILVLMSFIRAVSMANLSTMCGVAGVAIGSAVKLYALLTDEPIYRVTFSSIPDLLRSSALS